MAFPQIELSEINNKLEKGLKLINDLQEVNSRKYADKDQVTKMGEDVTKALGTLQELQQHQKGLDESSKILEKMIARMHATGGSASNDTAQNEINSAAKKEFTAYLRKGVGISAEVVKDISHTLAKKMLIGASDEEVAYYASKTLLVGQDPQGGYFVRPEILTTMITRIFETSPVRLVADTVTTAADGVEMLIDDNEVDSGGWVGETTARPTTATADIGKLTIEAKEQYANPQATQKMLDDAGFDIEAWLMKKITSKLTRTENTAFVVGNGALQPRGFTTYPAWTTNSTFGPTGITAGVYERFKIEQIKSGSANILTADGVVNLQVSLLEDYQANAVFMMQRSSFQNILTLKNAVGEYLINPYLIAQGNDKILLGKRVIFAADMPSVAAGTLPLIYGDFALGYTVVDRIGFRVIRDIYTNKPFVLFYTTKRTGGDVTNYQSLKIQVIGV